MKQDRFDVAVIGGGHAGCEAAHAAARMGARVCLITLNAQGIGVMSCNPAIGGLGKGHLVREIDALDGVMGRVADLAGIQFRLLNRRKGPAVQGPRAQADRSIYRQEMLREVKDSKNITIVEGEVVSLVQRSSRICGVTLEDGSVIDSSAVILTAGTFLRGVIHIGSKQHPGGRMGDKPSTRLAEQIDELGLPLGRLKTGTPPRLKSETINWDILESQPGDDDPTLFSFLSEAVSARQLSCGITYTNEKTHDIIRDNLSQSAMYGGHIEGVGPRYCPSIEDKVVRFSEKANHQIFLEPEGLTSDLVYPNGISTSLPEAVQLEYVRSIRGLEGAEIVQPGYAIEYDYVDPRSLNRSLAVRGIEGLFFAGQINGTTGYEEAAAQGLVTGLSAACFAKGREAPVFGRETSYIGVMVDDLVTRGVTEPYRMFTSRAEFRLALRCDNADQRLTASGIAWGCVGEKRGRAFNEKMEKLDAARDEIASVMITPSEAQAADIKISDGSHKKSAMELLALSDVSVEDLVAVRPELRAIDLKIIQQIKNDALYANYIERQKKDIESLKRDEAHAIPETFDFMSVSGLSNEIRSKLARVRPETLGQAGRIEGVTPAALTLILSKIRQKGRRTA